MKIKKVRVSLDIAKRLVDTFGSKILDDFVIYNPTMREEEVKKKDGTD